MIVSAVGEPPPPTAVLQAVRSLAQGMPIGIPTDTVYGLAVDPFRFGATDRIFAMKRRPRDVSLPLLVSGVEQALSVSTAVPGLALRLMERYWPGPLTLVIPALPGLGANLGEDDITDAAEVLAPGSSAGILVYENTWAGPFAAALRRGGGQLVASGRIPVQAVLASLDAADVHA